MLDGEYPGAIYTTQKIYCTSITVIYKMVVPELVDCIIGFACKSLRKPQDFQEGRSFTVCPLGPPFKWYRNGLG